MEIPKLRKEETGRKAEGERREGGERKEGLVGDRVDGGHDGGESVCEFSQGDAMDGRRGDHPSGPIGQVAGGTRTRYHRGFVAVIQCGAHGRADAHVGHVATDDELSAPKRFESSGKISVREGIRKSLHDHWFIRPGGRLRCKRDEWPFRGKDRTAWRADLLHMHDRDAGGAGAFQQPVRFEERRVHVSQRQAPVDVFALRIDHDDDAFAQA